MRIAMSMGSCLSWMGWDWGSFWSSGHTCAIRPPWTRRTPIPRAEAAAILGRPDSESAQGRAAHRLRGAKAAGARNRGDGGSGVLERSPGERAREVAVGHDLEAARRAQG